MTAPSPPRDRFALGLFGLGVLLPLGALLAIWTLTHEVTVIGRRHAPEEVREWRRLRDPRDDPAEIYGKPDPGGPRRYVVLPWDDRVELRPLPEAPGRELLFVDRAPGIRLLRPRAVLVPALALGGVFLLLGTWRGHAVRRKRHEGAGASRPPRGSEADAASPPPPA